MTTSHFLILPGLDARTPRASSPLLFQTILAASLLLPSASWGAVLTAPSGIVVGRNLEAPIKFTLDVPAPKGGLVIDVKSDDPSRLLLSEAPEKPGVAQLSVKIPEGWTATADLWAQGLSDRGDATYTASCHDLPDVHGSVRLSPSGVIATGPARFQPLRTSPGAFPSRILIATALLDADGKFVKVQPVRGGFNLSVKLSSSKPAVASISVSEVQIRGGVANTSVELKPIEAGETAVIAEASDGVAAAALYKSVPVTVAEPGLGITAKVRIGGNLESGGTVSLGAPAPAGGLPVTLTTADPTRLLLSVGPDEAGKPSVIVTVPQGQASATYFLHALADSGMASYTASAPGYSNRTAAVELTPGGFIITGPIGPPDEMELFRPDHPIGPHGFFIKKSSPTPMDVVIYTAQMDPVTKRCADITVQRLRAGLDIKVTISNSNSAVGSIPATVIMHGGLAQSPTTFTPKSVGKTVLSITAPPGFTAPSNATTLEAIVVE